MSVSPKLVGSHNQPPVSRRKQTCASSLPTPSSERSSKLPASASRRTLAADQRQELAIQALAGTQTISQLARDHQVSRQFVYQQTATAAQALHEAFDPDPAAGDHVIFYLPVTKAWLRQLILGLVLICPSSCRGVVELLRDLFDYRIALGTVHNIVQAAVASARRHNAAQDLSPIRIGAHDEIFQTGPPVLVGAAVASTFCYLLSLEEHRDAETWGIRLLELRDRGFQPDATIADVGSGLRAGQELALPTTPCRGDVFPALQDLTSALGTVDHRAYQAMDTCNDLQRKQARHAWRHGRADLKLANTLKHARRGETQAVAMAEDVGVLIRWLRDDVLAVAGPAAAERRLLDDFVVSELRARAAAGPQALALACRLLENHPEEILAFAVPLEEALAGWAAEFQVPSCLRPRTPLRPVSRCAKPAALAAGCYFAPTTAWPLSPVEHRRRRHSSPDRACQFRHRESQ